MKRETVRRRAIQGAVVALAGVGLWWLLRSPPVPVQVGSVTRGPLAVVVEEEGTTRVRDRWEVVAPVTGRLLRIDLEEGDPVEEGRVVARLLPGALDPRDREEARARLRAAEAAWREAEADRERAAAARDQAERDRARADALAGRELLAEQEAERARTDAAVRASEAVAAEWRARAARHDVETARAALAGAGPGEETGGTLEIRSPVAGRVLRVAERGGRDVAAGTALLEIGELDALEVVVEVLSADAVSVEVGDAVAVTRWGGPDTVRARVRRVDPSGFTKVSPLGVEEQRVNVVADLVDPPVGMGDRYRVEAGIEVWSGADVVRVPSGALWRRGDGWAAFVIEGGRARVRDVRVGHRGPDAVEARAGLEPGEAVVLYPGDRVSDGVRVEPE